MKNEKNGNFLLFSYHFTPLLAHLEQKISIATIKDTPNIKIFFISSSAKTKIPTFGTFNEKIEVLAHLDLNFPHFWHI